MADNQWRRKAGMKHGDGELFDLVYRLFSVPMSYSSNGCFVHDRQCWTDYMNVIYLRTLSDHFPVRVTFTSSRYLLIVYPGWLTQPRHPSAVGKWCSGVKRPHARGLLVKYGVWLRATETKMGATQWNHVAGKRSLLFSAVLKLKAVTCADEFILHALVPATSLLGL